jgi:class 3 adenylate cyclase/tetratricopeptide (TPR) repeat protein
VRKKYFLFSVLALLSLSGAVRAQKQGQALIDSLLAVLPTLPEDTTKVIALNNLSFNYRLINDTVAMDYANQCLELATRIDWPRGRGKAYNALGNCHKARSNYPEALRNFFLALTEFEKAGSPRDLAVVHMNIGTVYRPMEEYDKALAEYDKALEIVAGLKEERLRAQLLGNKGVIYFIKRDYQSQQQVNTQALDIFRKVGDRNNEAWILGNMGDSYSEQGNLQKGIAHHKEAIVIYDELNNPAYKATSLQSIGSMYFELAKADSVPASRAELLEESEAYLREAAAILKDMDDPDYLKDVYLAMSNTQALAGKHADALNSYILFTQLKDSVFSMGVKESIAGLETQREIEVREREIEIEQLKKRTEYLYIFGGVAVLLTVIVFTVSSNRRQRKLNGIITKEKEKSESLLHNILPEEVAEELKLKGTADARLFENVTVLFTDFKGFTAIAEQLSPKNLVAEIDLCFREFDRIIEKYNVEKIKTIGDAYMAVGGLPVANTTNAVDVVNAALEIQSFMTGLQQRRAQEGKTAFQIRIGIHSGPVVAGIVGVKKFAYDIWGDTVNTASRMESSGETGQVNISESTCALVKEHFTCVHRGKIHAKNKGEIDMYFVTPKQ